MYFFVSSVEFCKFNFEGKSDNGTGIQGLPGPTWATVQQGSSGPQVIKDIQGNVVQTGPQCIQGSPGRV
jgi:hypothetical protein